jgi:hypothetical protein
LSLLLLVAFTVDPLYHETTAQFDEGGAKGLLLYNLGVYGSCRVLFDSFEAPEKCILSDMQMEKSEVIDLSFAKGNISCFSLLFTVCILFAMEFQKSLLLDRAN